MLPLRIPAGSDLTVMPTAEYEELIKMKMKYEAMLLVLQR
jgi:hypothetical protein